MKKSFENLHWKKKKNVRSISMRCTPPYKTRFYPTKNKWTPSCCIFFSKCCYRYCSKCKTRLALSVRYVPNLILFLDLLIYDKFEYIKFPTLRTRDSLLPKNRTLYSLVNPLIIRLTTRWKPAFLTTKYSRKTLNFLHLYKTENNL